MKTIIIPCLAALLCGCSPKSQNAGLESRVARAEADVEKLKADLAAVTKEQSELRDANLKLILQISEIDSDAEKRYATAAQFMATQQRINIRIMSMITNQPNFKDSHGDHRRR